MGHSSRQPPDLIINGKQTDYLKPAVTQQIEHCKTSRNVAVGTESPTETWTFENFRGESAAAHHSLLQSPMERNDSYEVSPGTVTESESTKMTMRIVWGGQVDALQESVLNKIVGIPIRPSRIDFSTRRRL